jgi:hypothetical protein
VAVRQHLKPSVTSAKKDCNPIKFKKANFLYNLQLLQGDENIVKKAKDPEVWLNENYHSNQEDKSAYKVRNYINANFELLWRNISDFEKNRTKKLKDQLLILFDLT